MGLSILKINNPVGVIGLNKRNVHLIYPYNNRKDYQLADDKVKTKEILHARSIACAATFVVIRSVGEIRKKWKQCQNHNAMAIKPANGCGGGGIKILKKSSEGFWVSEGKRISDTQIFHHITSIVSGLFSLRSSDYCLIEECIVPHSFFAEIYDQGVPDFRVITLKETPIMAMLRMPTSRSGGKANLHQKGVGIGVNMKKGSLTHVFDGKTYRKHHPDNPKHIYGKLIPYWPEILKLAIDTARAFPLEYLGIDLVIDERKGPQVMEVNVRPGLGIQLVNRCGLELAIEQSGLLNQENNIKT